MAVRGRLWNGGTNCFRYSALVEVLDPPNGPQQALAPNRAIWRRPRPSGSDITALSRSRLRLKSFAAPIKVVRGSDQDAMVRAVDSVVFEEVQIPVNDPCMPCAKPMVTNDKNAITREYSIRSCPWSSIRKSWI
jgi:hypothetical protein